MMFAIKTVLAAVALLAASTAARPESTTQTPSFGADGAADTMSSGGWSALPIIPGSGSHSGSIHGSGSVSMPGSGSGSVSMSSGSVPPVPGSGSIDGTMTASGSMDGTVPPVPGSGSFDGTMTASGSMDGTVPPVPGSGSIDGTMTASGSMDGTVATFSGSSGSAPTHHDDPCMLCHEMCKGSDDCTSMCDSMICNRNFDVGSGLAMDATAATLVGGSGSHSHGSGSHSHQNSDHWMEQCIGCHVGCEVPDMSELDHNDCHTACEEMTCGGSGFGSGSSDLIVDAASSTTTTSTTDAPMTDGSDYEDITMPTMLPGSGSFHGPSGSLPPMVSGSGSSIFSGSLNTGEVVPPVTTAPGVTPDVTTAPGVTPDVFVSADGTGGTFTAADQDSFEGKENVDAANANSDSATLMRAEGEEGAAAEKAAGGATAGAVVAVLVCAIIFVGAVVFTRRDKQPATTTAAHGVEDLESGMGGDAASTGSGSSALPLVNGAARSINEAGLENPVYGEQTITVVRGSVHRGRGNPDISAAYNGDVTYEAPLDGIMGVGALPIYADASAMLASNVEAEYDVAANGACIQEQHDYAVASGDLVADANHTIAVGSTQM